MINYIPNDPLTQNALPMRGQPARADRPATVASFNFEAHGPEAVLPPGRGDFLFWQSCEAALAAVGAWEGFAGPLTRWAARSNNLRRIDLSTTFDDGETVGARRLNAYYDGLGVRFFDFDIGAETILSGISTDTVSHEVGHALLDSVRPELFQSMLPEVNAFHEAFGDCVAMLTALADADTRVTVLRATPDLSQPNFVEAGSEYLSDAIRRQFGNVSPSKPRRALNDYQWQLPSTLPAGDFQDPPELLSREAHSFSRVFTACFYDLIRSLFTSAPAQDEAALAAAAVTAGRLLVAAAGSTPETARYFQGIGRAMAIADQSQNGGANRDRIGAAFGGHGIKLGSAAMTAPTAALAGPAPKVLKTKANFSPSTLGDLRERISCTKEGQVRDTAAGIVRRRHRRSSASAGGSIGRRRQAVKGRRCLRRRADTGGSIGHSRRRAGRVAGGEL